MTRPASNRRAESSRIGSCPDDPMRQVAARIPAVMRLGRPGIVITREVVFADETETRSERRKSFPSGFMPEMLITCRSATSSRITTWERWRPPGVPKKKQPSTRREDGGLRGLHSVNSTAYFDVQLAFARREFKRTLPLSSSRDRPETVSRFGDELVEQSVLVRGQQFLRLRRLNWLLQNFPADPEFTRRASACDFSHRYLPPCQKPCHRTFGHLCPAALCR